MQTSRWIPAWFALFALISAASVRAQEGPERKPGDPAPGEERWQKPEGYKPLPDPSKRGDDSTEPALPGRRTPREPTEQGEAPQARGLFRARLGYRYAALDGTTIGKSEGFFLGKKPTADQAFRNGQGVGLDVERWIAPVVSIRASFSFEVLQGREVSTPVDRVEFDDLRLFKFSVGPRINWPFGIGVHRWRDPDAVSEMRGIMPYLRLGFGWAISSKVDVRLQNGQKMEYWSQTGSFHFALSVGFEYQLKRLGIFFELGVETFGPLHPVRDPEARAFTGIEFPFTWGLSWRF